ncbi:MAG: hypothetical protein JW795_08380 [Chitinivibrionales bacterium]|nr:hypothetical protein [Chitinivibrionales bacterium]
MNTPDKPMDSQQHRQERSNTTDTPPDFQEKNNRPTYERGKKYPAWMLIAIPFIVLIGFLMQHARGIKWWCVVWLVVWFETALLLVEHNSVLKGHWVYNTNRILGPTIFEIPIEEPLIYYLFPPIMIIIIFHIIVGFLQKKPEQE